MQFLEASLQGHRAGWLWGGRGQKEYPAHLETCEEVDVKKMNHHQQCNYWIILPYAYVGKVNFYIQYFVYFYPSSMFHQPHFRMKKLEFREVKSLTQSHRTRKP